jgi:peptide/nickel transport system substrate-binding protein
MTRNFLTACAVLTLLLGIGGCGSDADGTRKGGTLKVLAAADFQHIDPGQAYYQFDYMMVSATHRPLYWWKPDQLEQPTTDLAADDPVISDDGRTVTVRLRDGVEFSPPVNREVKAADVKYAIERGVLPSVANPYVTTYFGSLEGLDEFQSKKRSHISGIATPDDHTVVLRFAQPNGMVKGALSLPLTAPVPREYAARFDKGTTSNYGMHQVATGPYMLANDRSGKVTGYKVGERAVLVRNPNWEESTDFRPAHLDRIEFDMGNDANVASRQILSGRNTVSGDFNPPAAIVKRAVSALKDQIPFTPQGGNSFVSLNTTLPPLDDVNVRKAIVAGMDRHALRQVYGGPRTGDIATHFIPPGVPGFEEAGGFSSEFDYLRNPRGDRAVAASYMRKAGYEDGRYDGNARLLVVGVTQAPDDKIAEITASQLEDLGFDVVLRKYATDTMFSKFCQVPKAEVAVCPNLGWGRDFNDPQPYLDQVFNGTTIAAEGNLNFSQLDDRETNAAMAEASGLTDPGQRADAWAKIDLMITAQAPAVPWLWPKQATLRSANVEGVMNRAIVTWDISHTALE